MLGRTIQSSELGRCAAALALLTLASPTLAQSGRTLIYGISSNNTPKQRTWNGTAWSAEANTLDVGEEPRWIVTNKCPTRNETIVAVGDKKDDLNLMVHNGTTWGNLLQATDKLVTNSDRPFFAAYEQFSGDALIAYRVQSPGSTLYYRTWNGSAWSSQGSMTYWGSGDPKWVKMVPKPASNEIMVLVLDNDEDLSAVIWNGSSFTNNILLDSSTPFSGHEEFDAAYESVTGRCLIAWTTNGTSVPKYRIWSGSSWLSASNMPDIGGNTKWMRLAADPSTNKIIAMSLDSSSDVNAVVWSGSSWGSVVEFETGAPDDNRRAIDIAFEPAGNRALAMYGRSSQNNVYYRVYDGSSWSAAAAGPAMLEPPSVVQLTGCGSGQEILAVVRRKNDDTLCFMRWTGSALTGYQVLNSSLSGSSDNETFMVTGSGATVTKRYVASWCEVEPN